jgi:2-hydroxymuconate-semialdehyde hydrolase
VAGVGIEPAGLAERDVLVGGRRVHVLEAGDGPAVVLLHGSGAGTTAAGAWAPLAAALAGRHRVIAPDLAGFGRSEALPRHGRGPWTAQVLELLDALGVERFAAVGNSAGGAIALSLASARPRAVTRLVAVGTLGRAMPLPPGLDALWAYQPSRAGARELLELLFHDPAAVTDAAVEARLQATLEPAPRAAYPTMFPPPRERWVRDLALSDAELASIAAPVLLVHGAHDRVVPLHEAALPLLDLLADVRLHVFGACGHATPVERRTEFNRIVTTFLEDHV